MLQNFATTLQDMTITSGKMFLTMFHNDDQSFAIGAFSARTST